MVGNHHPREVDIRVARRRDGHAVLHPLHGPAHAAGHFGHRVLHAVLRGDRCGEQAGDQRKDGNAHDQTFAVRRRAALVITDTELSAIAAAASIGLSMMPRTG